MFEHRNRDFHVVYFLATGVPTDEAQAHLDSDTTLLTPEEACERLSFESQRMIAKRAGEVFSS